MQARRAKALAGFCLASPLHHKTKKTPGEAPGVEGVRCLVALAAFV